MGDPERYRHQDEVHSWQENDPIGIYQKYLERIISFRMKNYWQNSKAELRVDDAVEFAEASPDPAGRSI